MIRLDVYLSFPDTSKIKCGEIISREPDQRGYIEGAFRYDLQYLESGRAFPLDPVSLPLQTKEFEANRPEGIHSVFEDALPDDWGRKLLVRQSNLSPQEQFPAHLLALLGNRGMGALSFELKGKQTALTPAAGIVDLPDLLDAASRFDAGLEIEPQFLKFLIAHGTSPGGARPKALVKDESGIFWLSKFPKHDDSFSIESIEAACLDLARQTGLSTPEFRLLDISNKKVLLVKRFDVSNQNGRYHMISMQTLLKADGFYQLGYNHLFEVLKKYSFQPSIDIPNLFKQMVFNAAIGNTDDHLKNFCMLHKENGYCLSPVYDVLPDIYERREHSLRFSDIDGYRAPNRIALSRIGDRLNISGAGKIIDHVFDIVSDWKNVLMVYGVPDSDIQRLDWSVERRLEKLSNEHNLGMR